MASPLPDPFHPVPPLFPSRSKSTSLRNKASKSRLGLNAMLTASRAPSPPPAGQQARSLLGLRSKSQTRLPTFPFSEPAHASTAPPTWRAKFEYFLPGPGSGTAAGGKTLRRSNLKISDPIPIHVPDSITTTSLPKPQRRLSTSSTFSTASTASNISLASSSVSYGIARVVQFIRPATRPRVVDTRSPPGKPDRKLVEYFGVRPRSDRAMVARQRAGSEIEEVGLQRRRSVFREDFSSPPRAEKKKKASNEEQGDGGEELSEGLVKWFRCDIYPADAPAFHTAEAEAKRLVVEGGGRVMGQWTYPGGFMFQVPRNLASPLPPSLPAAMPTRASHLLLSHLGPEGHLRVTEFQPHLDPMQHLLSQSPYMPGTPNSGTSTIKANASPNPGDKGDSDDMMSAMEYITSGPSSPIIDSPTEPVEEIPLLRTSPTKRSPTTTSSPTTQSRQSFMSNPETSPEAKGRLHLWLQKQQASNQAKRKRDGQVYDLGRLARRSEAMLRKIEEEKEEGEWEDMDEAGSEFSVETGMESVKFVAECGSLF